MVKSCLEGDLVVFDYEGKTYTLPNKILPDNAKGGCIKAGINIRREQTLKL